MRAIEHAENELRAGRLWRAKEVLQGSLRHAGYDVELFEKLGLVLLTMGDLPQAGRYLFLCARRDPRYHEAIRTFLSRHEKNPRGLYQTFPRVAKLNAVSEYPEQLQDELRSLGLPEVLRDKYARTLINDGGGRFDTVVAFAMLGAVAILLILGVIKIFEIFRWFRSG